MYEEIKKLYEKIPSSVCDGHCSKCCTNMIQFAPSEEEKMGGYKWDGVCSHLKDGKCSIYENRPLICRIYGVSEMFICEGCKPVRTLTEEETLGIIHEYVRVRNVEIDSNKMGVGHEAKY
jgi:Fe-S-cluster containining protein